MLLDSGDVKRSQSVQPFLVQGAAGLSADDITRLEALIAQITAKGEGTQMQIKMMVAGVMTDVGLLPAQLSAIQARVDLEVKRECDFKLKELVYKRENLVAQCSDAKSKADASPSS